MGRNFYSTRKKKLVLGKTSQFVIVYKFLTSPQLLGFLNAFVWAGNLWFLWKETPWHNEKGKESTRLIPPKWKFQFLYNTTVQLFILQQTKLKEGAD